MAKQVDQGSHALSIWLWWLTTKHCSSVYKLIIRPHRAVVPEGLMFYKRCSTYFYFATGSQRSLGRSLWNFAMWSISRSIFHVIIQVQKLGELSPEKFGAKNTQNFVRFYATSDFDREYLRNESRYQKLEMWSRTITPASGERSPVNFGPLSRK